MKSQPTAKISLELLEHLISREFPNNKEFVSNKLKLVNSDTEAGRLRISAAILKLANRNVHGLDSLIEKANFDFRDIISEAEYPKNSKTGFDERTNKELESEIVTDWINYDEWLRRTK